MTGRTYLVTRFSKVGDDTLIFGWQVKEGGQLGNMELVFDSQNFPETMTLLKETYRVINETGYQVAKGQTLEDAKSLCLAAEEMSGQTLDIISERDGNYI